MSAAKEFESFLKGVACIAFILSIILLCLSISRCQQYNRLTPQEKYYRQHGITIIDVDGHKYIKTDGSKYNSSTMTHHPECPKCKTK